MTVRSWMLVTCPMVMLFRSPRSTTLFQTLTCSQRNHSKCCTWLEGCYLAAAASGLLTLSNKSTSPTTTALGEIQALTATCGNRLPRLICVRCLKYHSSEMSLFVTAGATDSKQRTPEAAAAICWHTGDVLWRMHGLNAPRRPAARCLIEKTGNQGDLRNLARTVRSNPYLSPVSCCAGQRLIQRLIRWSTLLTLTVINIVQSPASVYVLQCTAGHPARCKSDVCEVCVVIAAWIGHTQTCTDHHSMTSSSSFSWPFFYQYPPYFT